MGGQAGFAEHTFDALGSGSQMVLAETIDADGCGSVLGSAPAADVAVLLEHEAVVAISPLFRHGR